MIELETKVNDLINVLLKLILSHLNLRVAMYTTYWINSNFIYGPEYSGRFWIEGNFIYGPKNSGRYWIDNNFIYGPKDSGKFWISDGYIYGPSKNVPWIE